MAVSIFKTALDEYTAKRTIGQGGSGLVYEVKDSTGNPHALKLLNSNATKQKRKRFTNELQFLYTNTHNCIVKITDYGVQRDQPFYVMPLYPTTLRLFIDTRPKPDDILRVFSCILDGVEAAHLVGIVHRDLKPENILMTASRDQVVVADFGIAHFTEDLLATSIVTKKQDRMGNFAYAAPEQRTPGQKIGQFSDIFALGLILNELFTEQVPHGTGYKTIGHSAPDHVYLDNLVEQMIQNDPEKRPKSIEAVKKIMIGNKASFVSRQTLDRLENKVVPVSDASHPLIKNPVKVTSFDYSEAHFTFYFNQDIRLYQQWMDILMNRLSNYQHRMDYRPDMVAFGWSSSGVSLATIRAYSPDQQSIDMFKAWVETANQQFKEELANEARQKEADERAKLQDAIKAEKHRQDILSKLKI